MTARCFLEEEKRTRNIIDLGVNHLSQSVRDSFEVPQVVKDLSIAHLYLPDGSPVPQLQQNKIGKMVLLTSAGSMVNWHVDMTGTTVFYLVLTGSKVFYLVPSSLQNLQLFADFRLSTEETR